MSAAGTPGARYVVPLLRASGAPPPLHRPNFESCPHRLRGIDRSQAPEHGARIAAREIWP